MNSDAVDGPNSDMRYRDITEGAPDAQTNARKTQTEKLAAANDKAATASQTYQNTVKAAHDSAAAAKRKLSAPPKPPTPTGHRSGSAWTGVISDTMVT